MQPIIRLLSQARHNVQPGSGHHYQQIESWLSDGRWQKHSRICFFLCRRSKPRNVLIDAACKDILLGGSKTSFFVDRFSAAWVARYWKSSDLFSGTRRNSCQLPGTVFGEATRLRIPLSRFSRVEGFRLSSVYCIGSTQHPGAICTSKVIWGKEARQNLHTVWRS